MNKTIYFLCARSDTFPAAFPLGYWNPARTSYCCFPAHCTTAAWSPPKPVPVSVSKQAIVCLRAVLLKTVLQSNCSSKNFPPVWEVPPQMCSRRNSDIHRCPAGAPPVQGRVDANAASLHDIRRPAHTDMREQPDFFDIPTRLRTESLSAQ